MHSWVQNISYVYSWSWVHIAFSIKGICFWICGFSPVVLKTLNPYFETIFFNNIKGFWDFWVASGGPSSWPRGVKFFLVFHMNYYDGIIHGDLCLSENAYKKTNFLHKIYWYWYVGNKHVYNYRWLQKAWTTNVTEENAIFLLIPRS